METSQEIQTPALGFPESSGHILSLCSRQPHPWCLVECSGFLIEEGDTEAPLQEGSSLFHASTPLWNFSPLKQIPEYNKGDCFI